MIDNVIGFVDGLSLPIQCSDDAYTQNAAYNGYSHDTCCNNVFAFSPEGKVIYCAYNYPGLWHDATVAQGLINVVTDHIDKIFDVRSLGFVLQIGDLILFFCAIRARTTTVGIAIAALSGARVRGR